MVCPRKVILKYISTLKLQNENQSKVDCFKVVLATGRFLLGWLFLKIG